MADSENTEENSSVNEVSAENKQAEPVEASEAESGEQATGSEELTADTPVTKVANTEKVGRFKRLFRTYWAKKKWTLPVTALVLLILIAAVPFSRYKVLGLVVKQAFSVSVVDSMTNKPISGANVLLAGKIVSTNAGGKASLNVPVGSQKLEVSKKYYKPTSSKVMVPLRRSTHLFQIHLVATGRQVPISVTDKITGKGLPNVAIAVLGTDTKTDKNGKAIVVLPTTAAAQKASLQLAGYNKSLVTIQVTDQTVAANNFSLTATGKLYFLSNLSGKIDVVKTDLDGAHRQTVLAGTGSEDPNSTALLASRDWKYLALLAKRENGQQGIYLIDTSNDKVMNIDGGSTAASFVLVGWSNDTFVYQVTRGNISTWQPGAQVLKSYDATTAKLYNVDQSQGEGTGAYDYGYTSFSSVYILNNELVYAKNWYSSTFPNHLEGKGVSLVSAQPDGTNKKSIQDFPIPSGNQYYYVNLVPYEPQALYVSVPTTGKNSYYQYEAGKLTQSVSVTDDNFNKLYPTFLASPSGKQTFWSEVRDNKNALFVGDSNSQSPKQIATLSDFTPYGWYSDDYLLISKNGSELYVMSTDGTKAPLKITDYYKPQLTFRGYGGGYGGL